MAGTASDINDLLERISSFAPGGSVSLEYFAKEQQTLFATFRDYDPVRLAATFGGLLLEPQLQSSGLRTEALVHYALALGKGRKKPNERIIARLFKALGDGMLGRLEDPAEDVFVTNICTPRGNFRVLEGVWESAGFNLQRVINALERVPRDEPYGSMRENVYALLRLSDAVCARANLVRYQLGNPIPADSVPPKTLTALRSLRRWVRFSDTDIQALRITPAQLEQFAFAADDRQTLLKEQLGHSTLERFPLVIRNNEFHLILPTAVTAAIRRYVIECMDKYGMRLNFVRTLANEFMDLFADTSLLGSYSGAPLQFNYMNGQLIASVTVESDIGRYLNFVFHLDSLENFAGDDGLAGTHPRADQQGALSAAVDRTIDHAYEAARKESNFQECLTVFVSCGVGRMACLAPSIKKRTNWTIEYIGAADLVTLSQLPDFKGLSLWRLIKAEDRIQSMGVTLMNINGLLNMVGWARSLGGHLVPHGHIPDDFGASSKSLTVMIEQNAIRNVRHTVDVHWDAHVARAPDGSWIKVTKEGSSIFKEDESDPLFVAHEDSNSSWWPRAVYETPRRTWWIELERVDGQSGDQAFERFKMLKTWLARMAPILEREFSELPEGEIIWRTRFIGLVGEKTPKDEQDFLAYEDALASLTSEIRGDNRLALHILATPLFEDALFHPENIAERALVEKSVIGFAEMASKTLDPISLAAIVQEIVPDTSARQSHAFRARHFRDFIQGAMWRRPMLIDIDDSALLKLGLGWRARDRKEGGNVEGKEACTAYLNELVRLLEDDICAELHNFDRRGVIDFVLYNHESAIRDRDNWRRTAAAVLALHKDKETTLKTIAEHHSELNGVFQSSRLLVEFAICECPVTSGRRPGRLDMSQLMAKVMLLTALGGWSDAIRWDAMEPRLRITPLGDIHANMSFWDEILAPYARAGSDLAIKDNIESYAENLKEAEVVEDGSGRIPNDFLAAFEEQIGAPFAAMRKLVDLVEDTGIKRDEPIFRMKVSELTDEVRQSGTIDVNELFALLNSLTFKPRPNWRTVPEGYEERDRFPWRFRRRLSMLRLPLLQLEDHEDPELVIAPGIVRDAFGYMTRNYYRGDFPLRQLKPKMKKWAGASRDKLGHEFSQEVGKRLNELGWTIEIEVPVNKLLQKKLPLDYGDIDVLAWRSDTERVLLIECKDVQHRKTEGEVAEQLADFQGELKADGKPDLLLRHLNRVAVISEHSDAAAKYTGVSAPKLEGHLVFKNPVPMKFAWSRMENKLPLHILSDLDKI